MEASSAQQQKEKEPRVHRPCAFDKMEGLVREMQDPENGVPVRSQKQFLTSIPSAFMGECQRYLSCGANNFGLNSTVDCLRVAGYDLIEWLMERLNIEESVEAVHIANQLCQYGYFFPVNDSKTLAVKDDSSLYRFQTPYYWPWQHRTPDNVEYAIYLAKRTLRNKQRHALEDYEIEALNSLRKNLQNKWDIIQLQAEEQVRLSKERKKGDKIVSDSQERAFWRVYRPPPGCSSTLEIVPVPARARPGQRALPRKRTLTDLQREVDLLRNSLTRTRVKVSVAIENIKSHYETYAEYDSMISPPQPSNPWITDDQTFWQLNSPLVEVPTEKRVKRWGLSMEELMSDPTGLLEFTNYLRKEYSHENIRFWMAVKDLRHSYQAQIAEKVNEIFKEFLAPGAPCEINIDGKTMEKVHQEMKNPSRFTFDSAAEHVYALLLKKDCYPRFIRSDHYRNLLASGVQPLVKKRFFVFGGQAKKKTPSTSTTMPGLQQQHTITGGVGRRRGSDRSLSGSAHELAILGVRDVTSAPRVPHSHSQSNLTDIPYRGDLARFIKIPTRPSSHSYQDAGVAEATVRPMDDVCPWDAAAPETMPNIATTAPTLSGVATVSFDASSYDMPHHSGLTQPHDYRLSSRKNSSQLDSCSSSSDISIAIAEVSERLHKFPFPCSSSSGNERAPTATITRNYSIGSISGKVKLADTSRPSVSSYTCSSPQQSIDLSSSQQIVGDSAVRTVPEEDVDIQVRSGIKLTSTTTTTTTISRNDYHTTTIKSPGLAPLISISAIVGDLSGDAIDSEQDSVAGSSFDCVSREEQATQTSCRQVDVDVQKNDDEDGENDDDDDKIVKDVAKNTSTVQSELITEEGADEAQVVPVWDPDTQQDPTNVPTATTTQEQRDNNVNEVCPWEDEENCRVDTPYVKTYATLGYL
ncbi:uncharacterized protein LOC127277749 isoform X3 [Leptopilina boulardi]|uniref:uncharacterized protein LOC127277749 isoform X3 n=1 Tax=Leptopilina boulardi TaxID=63433 RepID=UPI0021F5340F|nr:uncharacterized protein LOC127277749 isoform X3 [Leptopilina boulardi]